MMMLLIMTNDYLDVVDYDDDEEEKEALIWYASLSIVSESVVG